MATFHLLSHAAGASISTSDYGHLPDGRAVKCYTLSNAHGLRARVLDYGATLAAVETRDRKGQLADITLGYDDLAGWLSNTSYFGATVGRYANRIAQGKFSLEGKVYALATNNSPGGISCHLHGGEEGFNRKLWSGRVVRRENQESLELTYVSPDGEEGYPGTLRVVVNYTLTENDELLVDYRASTDRTTIVNLTNHSYWNLSGHPGETILGHELELAADAFVPVDAGLIPTGEIKSVKGSAFDFTSAKPIGRDLEKEDAQIAIAKGYDQTWVLRGSGGMRLAASVYEPTSGRTLQLYSDQPGLQFYTGNFLDGTATGKKGIKYAFRTGFCLEPGKFPDSPNHPSFPDVTLRPGETYRQSMRLQFGVR